MHHQDDINIVLFLSLILQLIILNSEIKFYFTEAHFSYKARTRSSILSTLDSIQSTRVHKSMYRSSRRRSRDPMGNLKTNMAQWRAFTMQYASGMESGSSWIVDVQ